LAILFRLDNSLVPSAAQSMSTLAQPSVSCFDGCLGSISDLKLIEDIGEMVTHSLYTDGQVSSDFRIGLAAGN
jgi:hypothetical protein